MDGNVGFTVVIGSNAWLVAGDHHNRLGAATGHHAGKRGGALEIID